MISGSGFRIQVNPPQSPRQPSAYCAGTARVYLYRHRYRDIEIRIHKYNYTYIEAYLYKYT